MSADKAAPPRSDHIEWEGLSERSRATLRLTWNYLLAGWPQNEIAEQLGITGSALADALGQLREELRGAADRPG